MDLSTAFRVSNDPQFCGRVNLAGRQVALTVCAETDGVWMVERRALAYQVLRDTLPAGQLVAAAVADGVTLDTATDDQLVARLALVCDLLAGPYVAGSPHS